MAAKVTMRKLKQAYRDAKGRSEASGKQFLLTWEQWLRIWINSGHLYEKGTHKGQYVMARFGDKGPYATWNVKIIKMEDNIAERWEHPGAREEARIRMKKVIKGNIGRKTSEETKEKLSLALLGNKNSLGHHHTPESKEKLRKAILGYKRSAYTKAKISAARLRYWHQRKEAT